MNVFIVHAHPEEKSFNGALTQQAIRVLKKHGHSVRVSDLYRMNFNPVSNRRNFKSVKDSNFYKQQMEEIHASEVAGFSVDITEEIEKLEWCHVFIMQFPLWWFGLPGILKGWVDRVFVMGRVYGRGKWYDNGAFRGKRALLSLTTGGREPIYGLTGLHGDIDKILYPINHGILRFTGFDVLPPFIAYSVAHISQEDRKRYLHEYEKYLLSIETTTPIQYTSLSNYDEETYQLKS